MNITRGLPRLCASAVLSAAALSAGAPAIAAETTLRMVGAWAPGFSPTAEIGKNFMENVNRLGAGVVQIKYMGADDVLPPFDQPEALVNGVFDVWYGAPNYWAGVVPGGDVTELSAHQTPDGGVGGALHDFMVDLYQQKGVRFVGHAAGDIGVGAHYLNTDFPVTGIEDLKGKKLRAAPLSRHFIQAAGAESITLPPSEIFLAMDRGTVDGFTWPVADAFTRYGWQDVTKYMIDQPMYRSGASIAVNLAKWDALSPEAQEVMNKAMAETQVFARDWFAQNQKEQVGIMTGAGMEVVKLSPEAAEAWNKVAVDALWAYYATVFTPEQLTTVQELLKAK